MATTITAREQINQTSLHIRRVLKECPAKKKEAEPDNNEHTEHEDDEIGIETKKPKTKKQDYFDDPQD